ncbi:MAG: TonB-dependent receptor [Bryobacterales bacterium]|nr:TonB-dependent receptor [Bryobacterales bacterium]
MLRAAALFALSLPLAAQTTQGLISGLVVDAQSGTPLAGAHVACDSLVSGLPVSASSDAFGRFDLPLLSPGLYRLRVEARHYQAQEIYTLRLPVAGRLDLRFRLRPLADVWEQGQFRSVFFPREDSVLTFFGPDVDTSRSASFEANRGERTALETSVSDVVTGDLLRRLPLAGRDTYTMLALQPAVGSDVSLARGLGLSAAGQRPSSSNFLLDGLENNNALITGPLTPVAPEAVAEYRITTANPSAEYGRTAGFVANAVTRSGGNDWHGQGYVYFKNEALHANAFQANRRGWPRTPLKEWQPGFAAGGPLQRDRFFASGAFEAFRFRSRFDPERYRLPSPSFQPPEGTPARRLLDRFRPLAFPGDGGIATVDLAPPSSLNRFLAVPRFDWVGAGGKHRAFGRLAWSRVDRPDFLWSPYPDFIVPLGQSASSLALGAVSTLRPGLVLETKLGLGRDDLRFDRPHPEIPVLGSGDGVLLPGSGAFYSYRNRGRHWEVLENLLWTSGPHVVKFGGGVLRRRLDGYLTAAHAGNYSFRNLAAFAAGTPNSFYSSVGRLDFSPLQRQAFDREYGYTQTFAFVQDSWRAARRLVINVGLRYENYGVPRNTGATPDVALRLGEGGSFPERLAGAAAETGSRSLYAADANNFAARAGFAWQAGPGDTVVRGGYGMFYDRGFDNLWQNLRNNSWVLALAALPEPAVDVLQPIGPDLPFWNQLTPDLNFSRLTLFQPGLRDPYVQSAFLGIEHGIGDSLSVAVHSLNTFGRKLLATDQVNRGASVPPAFGNPLGRFQGNLPTVYYRGNQGASSFHALAARLNYRSPRAVLQAAYTWGHSIDNQSDLLAGDFFNFDGTRATGPGSPISGAAFTRQFDSRVDRGSSDFDQRHNVVLAGYWDLRSSWTLGFLAAVRSGLPYTVRVAGLDPLLNNRASLADPRAFQLNTPADGGRLVLSRDAFRTPDRGVLGNTGRNAFQGPGFFSADISLGRLFAAPFAGEAGRIRLRADIFNVLNHANLNAPESRLFRPDFGEALYGRRGAGSGFPLLTPLNETARQVQLSLRLEF